MQPSACIIVGPFSINCKKQSMRRGQHHLSRCWINAGEGREQSRGLAQGGTALDGLRYEVAIKCEQTGSGPYQGHAGIRPIGKLRPEPPRKRRRRGDEPAISRQVKHAILRGHHNSSDRRKIVSTRKLADDFLLRADNRGYRLPVI